MTVISVVFRALGMIHKRWIKGLEDLEIRRQEETIQKSLGTLRGVQMMLVDLQALKL